jgi:hypothetical protein
MQAQRAMEFELKGQVMTPMEVLLSVDGDPLKNLRLFQNTAHLHAIVKGGVFVKRAL